MQKFYEITDSDGNFVLSIKVVHGRVVECVDCEVDNVDLNHDAGWKRYSISMNKRGE